MVAESTLRGFTSRSGELYNHTGGKIRPCVCFDRMPDASSTRLILESALSCTLPYFSSSSIPTCLCNLSVSVTQTPSPISAEYHFFRCLILFLFGFPTLPLLCASFRPADLCCSVVFQGHFRPTRWCIYTTSPWPSPASQSDNYVIVTADLKAASKCHSSSCI